MRRDKITMKTVFKKRMGEMLQKLQRKLKV